MKRFWKDKRRKITSESDPALQIRTVRFKKWVNLARLGELISML